MKRRYVYRKAHLTLLMSAMDALGSLLFRHKPLPRPIAPKNILVIRLDHIGDTVLCHPFLKALRRENPEARIVFLTSHPGKEIYATCDDIDVIVAWDAPWFRRNNPPLFCKKAFRELKNIIASEKFDEVIDLRGDVRHIIAARQARPEAWLASFGVTGGGFLLDYEANYIPAMHAAQKNCLFLRHPFDEELLMRTDDCLAADLLSQDVMEALSRKPKPWIALHPTAGDPAKQWGIRHWKELAAMLPERSRGTAVWIGDAAANDFVRQIIGEIPQDAVSLCGKVPLGALGTLFEQCDFLIGTDSAPAHLAATRHVPSVILFGSQASIDEWKPLNPQAQVLRNENATAGIVVGKMFR